MSQAKCKDAPVKPKLVEPLKDVKKYEGQAKRPRRGWKSNFVSDLCIQVTAWLLFTVGLCIIVSTIYVGIVMRNDDKNDNNSDAVDYEYFTDETTTNPVYTSTAYVTLNKSVRALNVKVTAANYSTGCQVSNCRVSCEKTNNVYESFYSTCMNSSCQAFDTLLIKQQTFPAAMLRNYWIDLQRPIYELSVHNSNITRIRSGAFNSPLFEYTYQLSLADLQLTRVGSGALLGLKSLRYLIIITPLKYINRAFFQPVQSTLLHLRMNCGLTVSGGQTIFGLSTLTKLEYADLSNNVFTGALTREMFHAAPNLGYLHLSNSQITAINVDAFLDLKNTLQVLDLSGNLLTTISISTLTPLLMGDKQTLLSLAYNRWNCVCNIQGFANVYRKYFQRFLGTIYCHSPIRHNGEPLHKVNLLHEECNTKTTKLEEGREEAAADTTEIGLGITEVSKPTTTTTNTPTTAVIGATSPASNNSGGLPLLPDGLNTNSRSSSEDLDVIQMRCLESTTDSSTNELRSTRNKRSIDIQIHTPESTDAQDDESDMSNSSEEIIESEESDEIKVNPYTSPLVEDVTWKPLNTTAKDDKTTTIRPNSMSNRENRHTSRSYYKFEVPSYTLQLTLLPNNSVKVVIRDYNSQPEIYIIWFSVQNSETHVGGGTSAAQNIDYHCEMYQNPYLITDNLHLNCTYTFCMLPPQHTISPFNCLPLYVPKAIDDSEKTWISNDEKQFTISMLCMIFGISIIFGGIIAYFGIKTYPELLEGSKNVLVVKSSEPESDYLKSMGSIKKQPLSRKSTKRRTPSLPELPPTSLPSPPPFSVSTYNLERLSSIKSTSTYLESSFGPPPFAAVDDQYELPTQYNSSKTEERCVSNPYAMSPCLPPPLPKRNPSVTSSIIANRFRKEDN